MLASAFVVVQPVLQPRFAYEERDERRDGSHTLVTTALFVDSSMSRSALPVCMADEEFEQDWTKRVFSIENAGPWVILATVLGLQVVNALVPLEDQPAFLREVIPVVLGKQYARPPSM